MPLHYVPSYQLVKRSWAVSKGIYPSAKEVSHMNLYLPALTHLTPLTYVLGALRTFMLAGSTSATRVSGLSLRGLNLICRNAAQIPNKS